LEAAVLQARMMLRSVTMLVAVALGDAWLSPPQGGGFLLQRQGKLGGGSAQPCAAWGSARLPGAGTARAGHTTGLSMVLADSKAGEMKVAYRTAKPKGLREAAAEGQEGLSVFQDVEELGRLLGGTGKAKLVWDSLRDGLSPWDNEEGVTPKARALLASHFEGIPGVSLETVAGDGTTKMLVDLCDGLQVESVVIPNRGKPSAQGPLKPRTTLCVSSQVGCNRACDFCATGKMGFIRQLTAHEILAQVYHGLRVVREQGLPELHNVVFMGMGEPLNNPLNVMQAATILTNDQCFGLARSKVTVSTVGPSPAAIRAAGTIPAMLAWSVHAADDDLRRRLVPTTAHTMVELRDTFHKVLSARTRQLSVFMVAVTLIEGLNDGLEQADALVELLRPLKEVTKGLVVDLIPYNDIGEGGFVRAGADNVDAFQRRVRDAGFSCFVRVTRGDDELAACGQLATGVTTTATPSAS